MADAAPAKPNQKADRSRVLRSCVWGPLSAFGLFVAVLACVADQAAKFWLLLVAHLDSLEPIVLTPFAELVLIWNPGISYGLFPQTGPIGPWALLAFKVVAVGFLWAWLSRSQLRLTAVSLGLIIGGAVGNAIDRLHWPGVMDFVLLHVQISGRTYDWYVFNVADVAIVAGVVGLLYESVYQGRAAKAP
ncbi:MAG TPA: signal peptidase II [Xanthobacteraceae bacterium]